MYMCVWLPSFTTGTCVVPVRTLLRILSLSAALATAWPARRKHDGFKDSLGQTSCRPDRATED
eukprot:2648214-Alexandrium_andersonii.AAC.1